MVTPCDPLKHGIETDPLEELMGFGEASPEVGSIIQPAQVSDNVADITRQIEDRMIARYNGDYETADRIKNTLYTDFGVTIHDSRGMWESSDGKSGRIQGYTRSYRDRAAPVMPVECTLTAAYIQQQVQRRTELRRQWRYQEADGIRDELAAAGVELNDPANEWATYDGRLAGLQSTDREDYRDYGEE
jgi:cysteinyl-tRNA synthetase